MEHDNVSRRTGKEIIPKLGNDIRRRVTLQPKGSFERSEPVGLGLPSEEFRRDKKCSGEVNVSNNTPSSSVHSSSLGKLPAKEKLGKQMF
ncbi:hypothetical protein LIER_27172 [Lithospermum erythrorhizon]|uniref:Uncharacterized protein n=1 Tax=Lithospermum erythrorhizon TaxID=34254 RepID=A0AAV3RCR3_LITER